MKKFTKFQIASAFAGSILGAGFLSGQELYQFFGKFGKEGIYGMLIAIVLFGLLGTMVMKISKLGELDHFEDVIIGRDFKFVKKIIRYGIMLFLLCVVLIMTAGAGTLITEIFGLPMVLSRVLISALIIIVTIRGASGVVKVFSTLVPVIILGGIAISLCSFHELGFGAFPEGIGGGHLITGNFLFSTISFVSYNIFASIIILSTMARSSDEKTIEGGMILGSLSLGSIFAFLLMPIILHQPLIIDSQMPIITIAEKIHPMLKTIYGLLLICGMFSTAISCNYGFHERAGSIKNKKKGRVILFGLVILLLSFVEFKKLVAFIYPIFGNIGILCMLGIIDHYFQVARQEKIA